MPVLRRSLMVVTAAFAAVLPTLPSAASTADDLAAAKQRLAAARAAATEARAAVNAAEAKLYATEDRIAELQDQIAELQVRADSLLDVVRERARYVYTTAGIDMDLFIGAQNPLDAARGRALIDQANQRDNTAVKRLAAINSDLRDQTTILRALEERQRADRDLLSARNKEFQAAFAQAQQAADALQAKYDAEVAAAREAERRAALERERAALLASRRVSSSTNLSAGQVVANPGGGSFMCPVFGSTYTDNYGGPRGHMGIDMFVPIGTPLYAVKAGAVRYVAGEGAGGNTAYLDANDGNTYFYAHLAQFVGGARSVSQGEIIGLSGQSGNAAGPHLHFEIRIGGVNGTRINPYPTLTSAGC